jgi:hypothetical protein
MDNQTTLAVKLNSVNWQAKFLYPADHAANICLFDSYAGCHFGGSGKDIQWVALAIGSI